MCGRYYIDQEDEREDMRRILEEVNRRYQGTALAARLRTGEVLPTNIVPVLGQTENEAGKPAPSVRLMQWGMSNPYSGGVIINARAETAAEKPMFRKSVQHGRVLLPANGFFEWQKQGDRKDKTKYCLTVPGSGFFYMAGLYRPEHISQEEAKKIYGSEDVLESSGNGHPAPLTIDRFVIVTMAASPWMSAIHDRMPLILDRDTARSWLFDPAAALSLLGAPPASVLEAMAVE